MMSERSDAEARADRNRGGRPTSELTRRQWLRRAGGLTASAGLATG